MVNFGVLNVVRLKLCSSRLKVLTLLVSRVQKFFKWSPPPGFFSLLVCCLLVFSLIHYKAFCLHFATNAFCIPVFCPKLGLYLFPLQYLCLLYNLSKCILQFVLYTFISAAVILLASLAVMVQFSLTYDNAGRSSVQNNFILVFFKVFFGLNIWLLILNP